MGFFTDPFINWKRVRNYLIMAVIVWSQAIFLMIQEHKPVHPRAILLVVDGLRPDAIKALGPKGAPNFTYLIKTGASTMNARTDLATTHTLPNIFSILTGRPAFYTPAAHNYMINTYTGKTIHEFTRKYIHSVFDVLHDSRMRSSFFASKNKLGAIIKSYTDPKFTPDDAEERTSPPRIDSYAINDGNDKKTFDQFMNELVNFDSYFIFLHLAGTDIAGHQFGWRLEPDSEYLREVKKMDDYLGQILRAIRWNRHLKGQVYLIVTSDHGGTEQGHDSIFDARNYTVPFLVWGRDVTRGADLYELNAATRLDPTKDMIDMSEGVQPIRNSEAGNLALQLLGLPSIPHSMINALQTLRVKN